ncbi:MAG: hypothetical protein HY398_01560 [Candidatus Doudnabacteria bacterium]|nr:hypothetical protein [Candidatus Doudnabacteria bacterium]
MFHGNFTNHLKRLLRAKITEDLVNETLVALSTHPEKSIIQQEHQSFLGLVVMKQSRAPKEAFKEAFKAHLDKYFYLKHLWIGKDGVYDEQYYLDEVKKFKTSARELLVKENQAFRQTLSKRMKLLSKLKFVQKEKQILDVYAEFAITKMYRRDAQIFWAYKMDFVFSELSRRLKIPFVQTRFMFPHEVISALKAGWLAPNLKKELKERVKYCVYYAVKDRDYLFITKAAKELEAQIKQNLDENVNELVGQTACLGKAKGVAKIVNSPFDMRKMNKGDILVSIATNPDIVPAMKKAAAIVTEQGGITSHAAIVSRELGIPCVIGTKIATKVFKDGDLVEVDANKGTVRKISNF